MKSSFLAEYAPAPSSVTWSERAIRWVLAHRWLYHLLFWALSGYVILRLTAPSSQIEAIDYLYTGLFHLSLLVVVYLNLLLALPRLLGRGRYLWYLLAGLGLLGLGATLNWFTFASLTDWLLPGFYFISYYDWPELAQFMGVYLLLSSLLHLSKAWFHLQASRQQLAQLSQTQLQTELKALQAQVNPHFLFNTLSNLHALARKGDPHTATYILRLAEVMRYMIYDTRATLVPLDRELAYIAHYLELERLRLGAAISIDLAQEGEADQEEIAPLLLIPLVENAFKHGPRGAETGFVRLEARVQAGQLDWTVTNSLGSGSGDMPEATGGLGLANLRQRLDFLYPGRYQLEIAPGETEFQVRLRLDLRQPPTLPHP